MKAEYEFETLRTNVSEKAFYSWVKRELKRRTGEELSIWLDSFEAWASPTPCNSRTKNEDGWTEEIVKTLPCDFQYYLRNGYNFIMEWHDDWGYCYIVEFER